MSNEVLSNLEDSGLTLLQAKVYVALLSLGTSKAVQLCSASKVARPEVYRILRELGDKGLVNRNLTSPTTYTAVPPERALSLLVEEVKGSLAELELRKGSLVRALSSIARQPIESPDHRLSLVDGSENVDRLESQFLKEAKEEFVAIISRHGLAALDQPTTRAIISAKKRKLRIRILAEIGPSNLKKANHLSRFVEMRQNQGLLFYLNIYDRRRVLFGPAFLPTDYQPHSDRRELDVWTSNPRFVAGMYAMFEKLWQISRRFVPS
jgi:sugar-specific transcriptional regulator TrmB